MTDPVGPSILVVAGEVSGDMHAAQVVRALRARRPDLRFFGIGGQRLREAGMEVLVDAREMAVIGFWEVLKRYGFFRRVFNDLVRTAEARRPDAVLLIDYPGFNLRFAAEMQRRGVPVLYYICPQVWAWHRSRIPQMARLLKRLFVIFPFEVDVFQGTGLAVDYVGHPLVDEAKRERAAVREPLAWPGEPRVALLPGSRPQELQRILPSMWRAAGLLQARFPEAGFMLGAPSQELAEIAGRIARATPGGPTRFATAVGRTRQMLREAGAAMVKSGTATLEAALMGCPMIVVYRTATPTYWFARMVVRVPYVGMANLIAGREAFREFIQAEATPQALADGLAPLLGDTPERAAALQSVREVQAALGEGGAAERTADGILEALGDGARR